jgi:tRNA-modifying protein YgfZ
MGSMDVDADGLAAIDAGHAFTRPEGTRVVRVTGRDAVAWLHDLVTADVASLEPGRSRRSLLLTPTGRIRADFMVGRDPEGFWLLQSGGQPRAIDELLSIYVLSSDVGLNDVSTQRALWTLVGGAADRTGASGLHPSVVGPGRDVLVGVDESDPPWRAGDDGSDLLEVDTGTIEQWRIRRGDPRMGVDFEEGTFPAAAGLDDTIDATKGCFLGQESVAKIRELGHPPTVLRHRRTDASVPPGVPVFDADAAVGNVTSAAPSEGGGTVAIVRVHWAARDASLTVPGGARLLPVHRPD